MTRTPSFLLRTAPLAASLIAIGFSACTCVDDPPPAGDVCGTGTIDGRPHAIDPAGTRAVLVVHRNDGAGCGVFHSHVVNAKIATLEYAIDNGALAASTVKITMVAAGLDPDDPALRKELLPEGENQPLSDGDRASIRGSVAEEVLANEHPELVFNLSGFSAGTGAGTAKMSATLAGATSEIDVAYTVTKNGETFVVSGTATLDGEPYGIPRNSLGFCVSPIMDVHFDVTLVPVGAPVECQGAEPPPPYEPTFFDDAECATDVGYNEVRDVAVRRCAGCHAQELRLGATVPLVEWADWRSDSIRNQGRPLYETAHAYVLLDPADGLSMPPVDPNEALASPLTPEELALFERWVAGGARDAACANDPGKTTFADADFVPRACDDTIHYAAPGPDGLSAKDFFDNTCAYCHVDAFEVYTQQVPQVALLDGNGDIVIDEDTGNAAVDHILGSGGVLHPFYLGAGEAPLSFWEASVLRVEDLSMPPAPFFDPAEDPAFAQFKAWVEAGAPAAPCD
jgi:hypothetical protein